MHILKKDENHITQLHELFEKIKKGNTILFLGAGASITNKTFLSKDIIQLYEEKIGKNLETEDIIEFVDILQTNSWFDRNDFDNFVETLLRRLEVGEAHRSIINMPWNQIITTNYDVLLEHAYDESRDTNELELKTIRSKEESFYTADSSQIKYIKLNGCISDKSKYPLVFSSQDFEESNSFYNEIFNSLKGLSDRITFLSIGYSYSDKLASFILNKMDSTNYRRRRILYNVDPYVSETRYEYYASKNVSIINYSMKEFFKLYRQWEEQAGNSIVRAKKIYFYDSNEKLLKLPSKLSLKTEGVIKQLCKSSVHPYIKNESFLLGEQPNYDTIRRGADVKREKEISNSVKKIIEIAKDTKNLCPIVFSKGFMGSGKTTIAYQVIQKLINDSTLDFIAFEVLDYFKINGKLLAELFERINTKNIILFFNEAEIDSQFKKMAELRYDISARQLDKSNVIFYTSIRENILEKYKKNRKLDHTIEIKHKSQFDRSELEELIQKLKNSGLLKLKDKKSELDLVTKVSKSFDGNSFLTLTNLLTEGNHSEILLNAYEQLSDRTKQAFIFTSLVYRFKLKLPASILLNMMKWDWDQFRENIINVDGKGILFHEVDESRNARHDMYFKTLHPALSEILINRLIKSNKIFGYYEALVKSVEGHHDNSFFIIDLLKSLYRNKTLENSQINKLSDLAYNKFEDEPFYHLYYATNLQGRRTYDFYKKAISILIRGESLLTQRNHRFIHRRAVVNFKIAQTYFRKEKEGLKNTLKYLNEAEDLFELKQNLDPFSSYSYTDYLNMKFWEFENLAYENKTEELIAKAEVEDLIEFALRSVRDNKDKILTLQSDYIKRFRNRNNVNAYWEELNELYKNNEFRPYSLVLMCQIISEDLIKKDITTYIDELQHYDHIQLVSSFLFKFYGRRLHRVCF